VLARIISIIASFNSVLTVDAAEPRVVKCLKKSLGEFGKLGVLS